MNRSRFQQGVTLIELVVSLTVLAILVALAVPSFSEFFEKARLRGTADDVESFLNSQRLNAVRSDRDVNVSVRGSGTGWCIGARAAAVPAAGSPVPAATSCDCASDASECLVNGQPAFLTSTSYGAQPPAIDAADIAVVFDAQRGTLRDFTTVGDVVLTSHSGRFDLRVDVTALGKARTCLPSGSPAIGGFQEC